MTAADVQGDFDALVAMPLDAVLESLAARGYRVARCRELLPPGGGDAAGAGGAGAGGAGAGGAGAAGGAGGAPSGARVVRVREVGRGAVAVLYARGDARG
jgi:hypothetical protein